MPGNRCSIQYKNSANQRHWQNAKEPAGTTSGNPHRRPPTSHHTPYESLITSLQSGHTLPPMKSARTVRFPFLPRASSGTKSAPHYIDTVSTPRPWHKVPDSSHSPCALRSPRPFHLPHRRPSDILPNKSHRNFAFSPCILRLSRSKYIS